MDKHLAEFVKDYAAKPHSEVNKILLVKPKEELEARKMAEVEGYTVEKVVKTPFRKPRTSSGPPTYRSRGKTGLSLWP